MMYPMRPYVPKLRIAGLHDETARQTTIDKKFFTPEYFRGLILKAYVIAKLNGLTVYELATALYEDEEVVQAWLETSEVVPLKKASTVVLYNFVYGQQWSWVLEPQHSYMYGFTTLVEYLYEDEDLIVYYKGKTKKENNNPNERSSTWQVKRKQKPKRK